MGKRCEESILDTAGIIIVVYLSRCVCGMCECDFDYHFNQLEFRSWFFLDVQRRNNERIQRIFTKNIPTIKIEKKKNEEKPFSHKYRIIFPVGNSVCCVVFVQKSVSCHKTVVYSGRAQGERESNEYCVWLCCCSGFRNSLADFQSRQTIAHRRKRGKKRDTRDMLFTSTCNNFLLELRVYTMVDYVAIDNLPPPPLSSSINEFLCLFPLAAPLCVWVTIQEIMFSSSI